MSRLGKAVQNDDAFKANVAAFQSHLRRLNRERETAEAGGGPGALEKHRQKGKLPARERIKRLIDPGSSFLEVGLFAAFGMYEEYGGAPSSGTIFGIGKIHDRDVVVVANDATVKAGAWFPITCKKNLRAQEISMENRLPIVYLVDSAGVFLPLQSEIFPDKEHFGRIFRNNAVMSSLGITQIAAIMGPCVAGGAYLPIMSDEAMILDGSEMDEYKAGYGKTIITGYARIDGWAVGIVANQRSIVKTKKGEMQVGGVIYSDSADKSTRFILNCNQKLMPIVFFQD